jgi:hypothetical protein
VKPSKRRIAQPLFWFSVAVLLLLPGGSTFADDNPFVLPPWNASSEYSIGLLGAPGFAAESFLIYPATVPAGDEVYSADLTLWFQDDKLVFASYSFPVDDPDQGPLTESFTGVSLLLASVFGEPTSRSSEVDLFTTEFWDGLEYSIEHTLILEPGRMDHSLTLTPPISTERE